MKKLLVDFYHWFHKHLNIAINNGFSLDTRSFFYVKPNNILNINLLYNDTKKYNRNKITPTLMSKYVTL